MFVQAWRIFGGQDGVPHFEGLVRVVRVVRMVRVITITRGHYGVIRSLGLLV